MIKKDESFNGFQEIIFDVNDKNKTYASRIYYENTVRFSPSIEWDTSDELKYYLIHSGGGYISGEIYVQNFELKENADAVIMTQSSTKIFKSIPGTDDVKQLSHIHVGKNAIFQFYNDSVIAYDTARYHQENTFFLDSTSTLMYTDAIGPGWSPTGKKFTFHKLWTVNKIYINNKLIVFDNLKLEPLKSEMTSLANMGEYDYFGTLFVFSPKLDKNFTNSLYNLIDEKLLDVKIGISFIENNGLILRVFGNLIEDIHKTTMIIVNHVRQILLKRHILINRKY